MIDFRTLSSRTQYKNYLAAFEVLRPEEKTIIRAEMKEFLENLRDSEQKSSTGKPAPAPRTRRPRRSRN